MEELKGGRFLLYFDLLGMQAAIDDDLDQAAREIGQLHNLLNWVMLQAQHFPEQ